MTRLRKVVLAVFLLLTLGIILSNSAYAGSAAVGSVAGSVNATMGGRELLRNTTIFSGDSLQVKDGVAVIALARGGRLVFGHESTVSFSVEAEAVTAVLGQGNVALFCPDGGAGVRVKVAEVTIAPAKGFKTLGEVAMANGSVTITTKEGLLRVAGDGQAVDVAKGQTIAVMPKVARAPGGGAGGGHGGGHAIQFLSLGAGVAASALAGWAIHEAHNSQDSAKASIAAASAATQAAQAAAAAAVAAENAAVAAGCALNQVAHQVGILTSPYTPPTGFPPC